MNILRYLEKVEEVMPNEEKEFLTKMSKDRFPEYHNVFSRWMRENCYLWKNGTKNFVRDVKKLEQNGYKPKTLERVENKNLSDELKQKELSLDNPEVANHIMMDIFQDYCNFRFTKEQLEEWINN